MSEHDWTAEPRLEDMMIDIRTHNALFDERIEKKVRGLGGAQLVLAVTGLDSPKEFEASSSTLAERLLNNECLPTMTEHIKLANALIEYLQSKKEEDKK